MLLGALRFLEPLGHALVTGAGALFDLVIQSVPSVQRALAYHFATPPWLEQLSGEDDP